VNIDVVGPEGLEEVRGAVVVIDVLRAFTTAAHAFAAGAGEIVMVGSVEEAFALREALPGARLMGEVDGYPIEGFDFGNSPLEMSRQALGGARVIHRTTSGTRSAVAARSAEVILVASFVVAEATLQHLRHLAPARVSLVVSGRDRPFGGADDLAVADYLAARLRGEEIPAAPFVTRVRESKAALRFLDPALTAFPPEDLELALEVDRFDFAMVAGRRDGLLVLERAGAARQADRPPPCGSRPT
jgi:2-phosphosulfolactate phosphatase